MVVSFANISAAKPARLSVCMTLETQCQILVPVGGGERGPSAVRPHAVGDYCVLRVQKSKFLEETAVVYRNKQRLASNFTRLFIICSAQIA